MVSVESLVIVHKKNKVLLGLKLRGFGKDKWNGFGGKLEDEDNGDLERCVFRETKQEAGIEVRNLRKIGETKYVFEGKEQDHLVHIYVTDYFDGYPVKTEEMAPEWFAADEIPYDEMWHNDRYWIPYLLKGEEFRAVINMTAKGDTTSCIINGKEHFK